MAQKQMLSNVKITIKNKYSKSYRCVKMAWNIGAGISRRGVL